MSKRTLMAGLGISLVAYLLLIVFGLFAKDYKSLKQRVYKLEHEANHTIETTIPMPENYESGSEMAPLPHST
ncbi:MAG: hypothetical protein ACYSUB_01635 [Planctomycetota bacterium]|jgi:hypothetical protein